MFDKRPKVYLTGYEGTGWAIDEHIRLARKALSGVVKFTGLRRCDIIHSFWLTDIVSIPRRRLKGKCVICDMTGAPWRFFEPERFKKYGKVFEVADCFFLHNDKDVKWLKRKGFNVYYTPRAIDTETFYPIKYRVALDKYYETWNIPKGKYLIGNFHRDTEGANLKSPKMVKGPDIFVEIVRMLRKRGLPIHVVLVGPRRHWIRKELKRWGVPFTFVGKVIEGDDLGENILPRKELNLLYNLIDLYLITSREEGGPMTLFEAAAAKCKIISTDVGAVSKILHPSCICSWAGMTNRIECDVKNNWLSKHIEESYRKIIDRHTISNLTSYYRRIYKEISDG